MKGKRELKPAAAGVPAHQQKGVYTLPLSAHCHHRGHMVVLAVHQDPAAATRTPRWKRA